VESNPNEGEGEGEGEEQRGGDGLRDDGNVKGRSLSTVHAAEQWKMQKTAKEKGKGKGKSSAAEASGERELLSTDGRQSFFFSSVFALLLLASCLQK
jgi:hypothetical protein